MGKTKRNICFSLYNREISRSRNSRKDFKILRTLICHCNRNFEKVWSATSKTNFHYESGRIFSDHYKTCHFGYSICGGPRQLYKTQRHGRLEDALIYRCCHENFHRFDNKAYLFGVQSFRGAGASLVQFSLDTGQECRDIMLSHTVKFKSIAWVDQNEMFVVRSKQLAERTNHHQINRSTNVAMVMAVFSAFPLEFVGMFEVDRKVFGQGIQNAILTHGFLIIMFSTGHVRFYSFKYILEKFKQFDHQLNGCRILLSDSGVPNPLPVNIKITECPPVLFEVRCWGHDVQIGGFPWHYIIQPYKTPNTFDVFSLQDGEKTKDGTLKSQYLCAEADSCLFHNDNSGRILHLRAPEVGVYKLGSGNDFSGQTHTLNMDAVIHLHKEQPKALDFQITSSGRCIKRRELKDEVASDQDVVIHQVDYEDDLDLAVISATCRSRDPPNIVCFYDNWTFELLREISLEKKLDEPHEYSVYVDLDTVVEVAKILPGRFLCTVYRLSGSEAPGSPNPSSEAQEKSGTSSHYRGRRRGDQRSSHRTTRRRRTTQHSR